MSMLRTRSRRDDPVVVDPAEPIDPTEGAEPAGSAGTAEHVEPAHDAPNFEQVRLDTGAVDVVRRIDDARVMYGDRIDPVVDPARSTDVPETGETSDTSEPFELAVADAAGDDATSEEPATVDPRLRARRVEVRRANARRRRRRRWMTLGIVAVLVAVPVLLFSPLLSVRSMSVRGTRHLLPEQITQLSGISGGDAMVTLDPDAAADAIRTSHWVRRVTIDRRWPWSVDIVISERRLAAVVAGSSGAKFLVADDGVVLEAADVVAPRDATTVLMPDVAVDADTQFDGALTSAVALAGNLPSWLAPRVTATVVDAAGRITFTLDKGITLVFGMAEDGERKLTAAQTLLGGAVVDKDICQVDVSVAGASTLRRAPDCA